MDGQKKLPLRAAFFNYDFDYSFKIILRLCNRITIQDNQRLS